MIKFKKTLFISDLHLQESQPEITRQFLQLLNQCDDSVDRLYILGDLFEAWIGDDDQSEFTSVIIQGLQNLTQRGVPVYFLPGNRDFLIGNRFLAQTGCLLLADETRVFVYNTPVLLMHGDTLCTNDLNYLKMRRKFRQPLVQKLFLLLPLRLRQHIANKLRLKSQKYTQFASLELMDVVQQEVEKVMRKHKVECLIHGHTHRPGVHQFNLDSTNATRIVLGAWHGKGHVLIWNELAQRDVVVID